MRKMRKAENIDLQNMLMYYGTTCFIVGFSEHNHALKNYLSEFTTPLFFSFSTKQLGFLYIFYILYLI